MEQEVIITPTGPDYTVWGLVMQADPVVKGTMLLLVLASVACWAVIFEKLVRIVWLNRAVRRLVRIRDGEPRGGLAGRVLEAGDSEFHDLEGSLTERRYRAESAMRLQLKSEIQQIEVGLPFLATIGSAAPFIGLFGTVWGIVNSFTAIAQQKDTSLAVVAPGIAEALIATALGLAAAIPAVIAYNQIAVALGRSYARGNNAVIDMARKLAADDKKAPRPRGANVEPLRAGKHS